MGKPNTYVQLLNARREIEALKYEVELMKGVTLQQALDFAQIALNRVFQFGPKSNKRFEADFKDVFHEFMMLCVSDSMDDEEVAYYRGKVDRALAAACGEIKPFDTRFDPANLYFRDKFNRGEKW